MTLGNRSAFNEKIWRLLNVSSFTVHNIIQKYSVSGEIAVHKGLGWKSIPMIVCPSYSIALKTDMILSWKSLHGFSNTSRNYCLHAQMQVKGLWCKEEAYVNIIQKCYHFLWAKLIKNGQRKTGKMFCGQTNQNFKFFWENMDTVLDLRGEGLSGLLSTLITTSVPTELAACASGKASNNAEKCTCNIMLPSTCLSQGRPCIFH